MTATWADIQAFLIATVVPSTASTAAGTAWLTALGTADDGQRLGICLAIDVGCGALEPGTVAALIDQMDITSARASASAVFGAVLAKQDQNRLTEATRLAATSPTPDQYVRILELGEFITYYAGPTYSYTLNPADVEE